MKIMYKFIKPYLYRCFFIFLVSFGLTNISMAKKCNVDPKGFIDINIASFNPEEITKATSIYFSFFIVNITNMNIEIPVRWMQTHAVSVKFINLDWLNNSLIVTGDSPRNFKDGFISAEPQTSSIFKKNGYESAIQKVTNGKPAHILAVVSVGTYLRYPGASEFIGTYKNGKFEPTYFHCSQEFRFTYK